MKINALLDVNLLAHETQDEVALLLELEAPNSIEDATRVPASLQVVLDRSGSMSGAPLEGAKKALVALVRRLQPTDNFGLVTFDNDARVEVAAGPLKDKEAVIAGIQAIQPGGSTDLGAGYLRGLRELRRVNAHHATGGTLLIISDGHVNSGITDVDEFASLTAKASVDKIATSTLGYGQGYDETLLSAIARSGNGNHAFADNPDAAGVAISEEVEGLLNKVIQAATLTIRPQPAVEMVRLYNDLPVQPLETGLMVELGDFYSAEQRKILLKLRVPAMAGLGLATIAALEIAYVELPGLVEHTTVHPVSVNVVPGDEAAGRIPHPTVHSEVLFQEAQDSKRQASEAFETGDLTTGRRLLDETKTRLRRALDVAPTGSAADIRAEIDDVENMDAMTLEVGSAYMSKMTRESYHRMNRKRGRTDRPGPNA